MAAGSAPASEAFCNSLDHRRFLSCASGQEAASAQHGFQVVAHRFLGAVLCGEVFAVGPKLLATVWMAPEQSDGVGQSLG